MYDIATSFNTIAVSAVERIEPAFSDTPLTDTEALDAMEIEAHAWLPANGATYNVSEGN